MNPVDRPSGSGPDPSPRSPIAGPGIPTAASFADDIAMTPPSPDPVGPAASVDDAPAAVTPSRRPPPQRRRRRFLGRSHEPRSEPDHRPHVDPPSASQPPPDPAPIETETVEPADRTPTPREKPAYELAGESDPYGPPGTRRVRTLRMSAPPTGPPEEAEPEDADPVLDDAVLEEPEEQRVGDASISGHVVSTRGRGLSGVSLVVVGPDDQVVGTTVTGRRGQFAVEDLPSGTYRVGARDGVDGDFVDSWHGGEDAARATELRLDDAGTAPDTDITLIGRVAIDAAVDVGAAEIGVDIQIRDRSTGLPAEGLVIVSTDQFRAQLPLTDGHATLALLDSVPGDDLEISRIAPRLRVEYPGSAHSGPATRTIRLR